LCSVGVYGSDSFHERGYLKLRFEIYYVSWESTKNETEATRHESLHCQIILDEESKNKVDHCVESCNGIKNLEHERYWLSSEYFGSGEEDHTQEEKSYQPFGGFVLG